MIPFYRTSSNKNSGTTGRDRGSYRMRVLELFPRYLRVTENWIYRMLDKMSATDIVVASKNFLECDFYTPKFEFIRFPAQISRRSDRTILARVHNGVRYTLLMVYPWYLQRRCGQVDLMHSHFAPTAWHYLGLAKRLQVPHLVSFYGLDYEMLPHIEPVWRSRYRTLFKHCDMFLCEGRHGKRVLKSAGCPVHKIRVCRLGVDVEKVPFVQRRKTPGRLRLLQVAAMTEKKGHFYTMRAFIEALKSCPDMTLTLVGGDKEGELRSIESVLRHLVAEAGAQDKVEFVPRVEFSRLYDFMAEYDVFIHPSVHAKNMDAEGGAPVVLLDAQATGMPVISTEHCDIPDEVIHGKTGLLAPERDLTKLTDHIVQFYKMDNDDYQQFANAARAHVAQHYELRKNAHVLRNLYQQVVSVQSNETQE